MSAFAAELALREGSANTPFDLSDGLSLHEAEPVALVYNPELRVARLEAGIARATSDNAGRWQDPIIGIDIGRLISSTGGADPWDIGGSIGLTIPISGRLEAERARASAAYAEVLLSLAAREWATRSALRERWIEWSVAARAAEILSETVYTLAEVVQIAEQQERAGVLARVEARAVRLEHLGREADLIALRARTRELELSIRALIGLSAETHIVLQPALHFQASASSTQAIRHAIERASPDLLVARAAHEVAERDLAYQIRLQHPDITIGPGFRSDQGDDWALLGLSLPIPLWNRNREGIERALAARAVSSARYETTYEQLDSRLTLAMGRYEAARARREMVEQHLVPLADAQWEDVRRVAALGRVDPLLLLETIKASHDAKTRLLDATGSESIGAVWLEALIGPPDASTTMPRTAAASTHEPSRPLPQGEAP